MIILWLMMMMALVAAIECNGNKVGNEIKLPSECTRPQVTVAMLYSEAALQLLGDVTEEQVVTILAEAIATSNLALKDSGIPMELEIVFVGEVRAKALGCRMTLFQELQRLLESQTFDRISMY